ncbi:hypothetical protein Tco_0404589 [Tanacetum coccineum]
MFDWRLGGRGGGLEAILSCDGVSGGGVLGGGVLGFSDINHTMLKNSPIPPSTITSIYNLSPMFNPQEFLTPEELLSPKKQGHNQSFYSTSALPQEFKMGESSRKTSLERHEEQKRKN